MSQATSSSSYSLDSHIEITPGTCGGKPRIAGHRIRVADVVVWIERMGLSADEIVSRYPQLALSDVYAALAYYHDHRQEIDEQMKSDEKFAEEMRKQHPSKVNSRTSVDE